jgi:hypothetical protein
MLLRCLLRLAMVWLSSGWLVSAEEKLEPEQRMEIIRGLSAEFATAKVVLPKSKKPLEVNLQGGFDKGAWEQAAKTAGLAARAGDLVQITKVEVGNDRIVLEINDGPKGKRRWYHNIEVGMGTRTTPVARAPNMAPGGTNVALVFGKAAPPSTAAEIKKLLAPVLDFEKRSATEQYVETLPAPIQAAIKEKKAIEGMDRDQVLLALGKPVRKHRETRDGVEYEDWIYGNPPGKVTFVTFEGNKVVRVKETYAGVGGAVNNPLPPL